MADTTGMVNIGNDGGMSRFFDIRHDAEMNEFEAKTLVTQDYVPTLTENHWQKVNGNDGWTKERTMRRVASIPTVALQVAKDQGWDLDDQNELRSFIAMHPEWMTVQAMKRQGSPNIIIK